MTAVEWLEETSKRRNLVPGDFEQAKEMEKEQMKELINKQDGLSPINL